MDERQKKRQLKRHNKRLFREILLVFLAILLASSVLLFVKGPDIITKSVRGLTLEQDGFDINVSWKEMDCEGYDITIQCEGRRTMVPVEDNSYTIHNIFLFKTYSVTVTARLKSGHNSRAASADIVTEKIKQDTTVDVKYYEGLAGDEFKVTATGIGPITFSSEDKELATVNERGRIKLHHSGHTKVIATAAGDGIYDVGTAEVEIDIFPDELDQPKKPSVKYISNSRALLEWKPVEYAKSYRILKKNIVTGKYKKLFDTEDASTSAEVTRATGKYAIKPLSYVRDVNLEGPKSDSFEIKGAAAKAKSYSSSKIIKNLNGDNLTVFRQINGDGKTRVPQSLSQTDDSYVVSYVNMGGSTGKLISYDKDDGECTSIVPASGMGHANGTTYNPNTNKFYVVKTHKSYKTNSCSTYDGTTKASKGSFDLPKITSGIAYDESNNKFYLSKGNEIYVCDSKFNVEKFIPKRIRYNHAQDVGAYNGVVLVCTWVSGSKSFIDMYRASDGDYLGSYNVSIGEVESCVVDDGYLVILMNKIGTSKDYIYKTKERIDIP